MPIPITMPQLSPTMTEGTLARWLKQEGEAVQSGDVVAEIETDKATMELEVVGDGILGRILIGDGSESIAIGTVIGVILEEGEDAATLQSFKADQEAPAAAPAVADPAPAAPAQEAPPPSASAIAMATAPVEGERVLASPLARRMAAQAGLDLARLSGSGPHGRIVKQDIEAALAGGVPARAAAPAPAAPVRAAPVPGELYTDHEVIPHTNMRKVIARRLTEAKQTVPHFYLTIDCEIDALLVLRKDLNDRSDDYRLSVNDFVVRAAALALRQVPAANASWTDAALLRYLHADVAVAVAIEGGLITPIVRQADAKGLAAISNEMKEMAGRARKGKLMPEEYQGGTFSVSNLGMYGIREFSAVINPPHGAILAVGAGEQRPVVKDGALAIATVMSCTLSCDHRVVDGVIGAEFLAAFKGLIQDPITMLL